MELKNLNISNYNIALRRQRVFAALIDLQIIMIPVIIFAWITKDYTVTEDGINISLKGKPGIIFICFWFILLPIIEGYTGQTIGKKLLRLKVVQNNLAPVNIPKSIFRHLFDFIDFFFFIGLFVSFADKNKRRIADIAAGTIVVSIKND
jgi:uncharacterized RDD family membrane protein YckC